MNSQKTGYRLKDFGANTLGATGVGTRCITNGQTITVNGTAGLVIIETQ